MDAIQSAILGPNIPHHPILGPTMAGRPRGSRPLTEEVKIRLDSLDLTTLDEARGRQTRAGYIRGLIRSADNGGAKAAPPVRPTPEPTVQGGMDHVHKPNRRVYGGSVGHRWYVWECACGWRGPQHEED